jgi:hypothetical protein
MERLTPILLILLIPAAADGIDRGPSLNSGLA